MAAHISLRTSVLEVIRCATGLNRLPKKLGRLAANGRQASVAVTVVVVRQRGSLSLMIKQLPAFSRSLRRARAACLGRGFALLNHDNGGLIIDRIGRPKRGQRGQVGQKDLEKEQQTSTNSCTGLALLTSIERLLTGFTSCFPGKSGLENENWVGWDSNPQPTP